MKSVDVVKRDGKRSTESFERAKLERSIRAAMRAVKAPEGQAEDTASAVCDVVMQWLGSRPEVTSADLRRQAVQALEPLHPEAAIIYKHYKVIM